MFESMVSPVGVDELEAWVARLGSLDGAVSDAERVREIELLERLKGAAAAAQARVSVDLDSSQREVQAAQGVPARRRGAGVADQIALARRDSRARGSRHLGLARALVTEMPHTLGALGRGDISEWRATVLVRETAGLSADDRRAVDARLAERLPLMGDRQVERAARSLAYELDPEWPLRRARGAVADRRVTIRPAPEAMTLVTGFLPVAQGVAVFAALDAHAKERIAAGDARSKGQIMADTFTERLTGQQRADAVSIEVGLVMTDATLLGDTNHAAQVVNGAVVPAGYARDLVLRTAGEAGAGDTSTTTPELAERARVWVRRLFVSPADGTLVAMDSRRREFDGQLRSFLVHRDQFCRSPWCGAPIRHADHVRRSADLGETSAGNGQGLCARCNQVKELPGWGTTTVAGPPGADAGPHTVRWRAPTGHRLRLDRTTRAGDPCCLLPAPHGSPAGQRVRATGERTRGSLRAPAGSSCLRPAPDATGPLAPDPADRHTRMHAHGRGGVGGTTSPVAGATDSKGAGAVSSRLVLRRPRGSGRPGRGSRPRRRSQAGRGSPRPRRRRRCSHRW